MAVTLPVVNGSSGVWGTILNAALTDIDNRLVAATSSTSTHTGDISNLTTRVGAAETSITALQNTGGATYSSRAALPTSATNGTRATTTDTGVTWTHFGGYWYPPPGTVAGGLYQASAQSLPNQQNTLIQFDSTRASYLLGSYSFGSAASWNCTAPGWYTITGGVSFTDTSAGSGYRQATLFKGTTSANAAAVLGSSQTAAPNQQNGTTTSISTRTITVYCEAGERVFLYGNHSQGSAINTASAALSSFYSTLNVVFAGWFPTA